MAKIKHDEIADKDLFGELGGSAKKAKIHINRLSKGLEDVVRVNKKIADQNKDPKSIQQINALSKASANINTSTKELNKTRKVALDLDKQIKKERLAEIKLQKDRERAFDRFEKQEQKNIKTAQKARKTTIDNANAYKKLTKQTNVAQSRFKRLAAQYGVTSKAAINAGKTFRKLDDRLRKINKSARDGRRDVGRYSLALNKAKGFLSTGLGVLGITAGIAGLGRVIGNVIGVFSGFEKANSNLKAILGASGDEMDSLKDSAKELGSITAFTSSQITALQTEFAKLGFDAKQIDNATESTLALAAAAGVELAEAAAVAGATLGGFGLDAAETGRVTDVMAKSFSISALDMEKFKESMKSAAPAAKAVGINVERTTALLGTLANAGISGSKAGNNLKTSFINLNKAGLTLDEGLAKVANSQDKLGTATELVGKNSAASFLVLSEGVDTTARLTEGLNNAAGAAQKMADIQLDNLAGDVTILGSAFEGFILSIESGEGAFNGFLRSVVKSTTGIISSLTKQTTAIDKNVRSLEKEQEVLFELSSELLDANTNASRRNELLNELEAIYPDMLANIDKETVSYEKLREILERANSELNVRLQIQQALVDVDSAAAILRDEKLALAAKETQIQREIIELFRDEGRQNELLGKSLKERIALTKENFKLAFTFNGLLGDRDRILTRVAAAERRLNDERKLSNEVITALLTGATKLESLTTKELRALVLNGQLTDKKLIRDAKSIIILRERAIRLKKFLESIDDHNKKIDEEKEISKDLIDIQRARIKLKNEEEAKDEPALARKNRELQILEEKLKVLLALGRLEDEKDEDEDDESRVLQDIQNVIKEGKIAEAQRTEDIATEFRIREEMLRNNALFERNIAGVTANERRLIAEQLANDLAALEFERVEAVKAANDEIEEDDEDSGFDRLEFANEIAGEYKDIIKERNREENSLRNDEISRIQESITEQERIAREGGENILAEERGRLAKANLERERALKEQAQKEQALALALVFLNALAQFNKDGEKNAFNKALLQTFAAKGIVQVIKGFEKGGLVEGGEQLVNINEKGQEFVIDAATTKSMGLNKKGSTMKDFDSKMSMMGNQNLFMNPLSFGDFDPSKSVSSANSMQPVIEQMKAETQELKSALKQYQSRSDMHYDSQNRMILRVIKDGMVKLYKSKPMKL